MTRSPIDPDELVFLVLIVLTLLVGVWLFS
jgi:hypothetical protein